MFCFLLPIDSSGTLTGQRTKIKVQINNSNGITLGLSHSSNQLTLPSKAEQIISNKTQESFQPLPNPTGEVFVVSRTMSDGAGGEITSPEKLRKIDELLLRLSPQNEKMLLDSPFLANNDFIDLAERLSDDQLSQLFTTFSAGHPQPNRFQNSADITLPANGSFAKLIDNLNQLDDDSISRVIDSAEELSHTSIRQPEISTYLKDGKLMGLSQGDLNNDLFNFIKLISTTVDLTSTLDQLDSFSSKQQSMLLSISEYDIKIGEKLLTKLSDTDEDTINSTLYYFTDKIKETARPNSQIANLYTSGKMIAKARITGSTTSSDMAQLRNEVYEKDRANLKQLSSLADQ